MYLSKRVTKEGGFMKQIQKIVYVISEKDFKFS